VRNLEKTVFEREGTEKATVITKKQNFHHIKMRILSEQYHFLILISELQEKLFVLKKKNVF